jgi:hypothetical protein
MEKQVWVKRWLQPVLTVMVCMAISHAGYFGLRHVGGVPWHHLIAGLLGSIYFVSIAFGTLYIYPTVYLRGGTMRERVTASFVNPLIWMSAEVLRLCTSHPFQECLYWYLNPLNIWLVSFVLMEMGVGAMMARTVLRRQDKQVRIIGIAPVAVVVFSLAFAISIYAWGEGENIYVWFLKGYRIIFGTGV